MEQKPEPTYTREQVQQVLEAAAEYHGNFLMTKTSVGVLDVVISQEAVRAIDIDAVVKGE